MGLKGDKDYFDIPALSKTLIKRWVEGDPHAFWQECPLNPNRKDDVITSDALVFGQLVHCLLLEPDSFKDNYEIVKEFVGDKSKSKKRGSPNNLAKSFVQAQAKCDKYLILESELVQAQKVITESKKHSAIKSIMKDIEREKPLFWEDKVYNMPFKAKLDGIKRIRLENGKTGYIGIELKVINSADLLNSYTLDRKGYDIDLAMYDRAIYHKYGEHLHSFYIIMLCSTKEKEHLYRTISVDYRVDFLRVSKALDVRVSEIVKRIELWKKAESELEKELVWKYLPHKHLPLHTEYDRVYETGSDEKDSEIENHIASFVNEKERTMFQRTIEESNYGR